MQDNKLRTLQVYRDQAAAEFEAAWRKFESSQNPRDRKEFEKAEKSLRGIEAQMKKFRQSSPNLQVNSTLIDSDYFSLVLRRLGLGGLTHCCTLA